jgi:hypothetical protein
MPMVCTPFGQQVRTLVNPPEQAGYKSIAFDGNSAAGGLPSGMYFCRIAARPPDARQAGAFTDVKKMVLMGQHKRERNSRVVLFAEVL